MDVKAVKLELVQKILETREESILEQIRLVFEQSTLDWWELTDEGEKKAIEEGLAQLEAGEAIPHEEVLKKMKEKFNLR